MAKGDTGTQQKQPSTVGKKPDIMAATTFQNGKVREGKKMSKCPKIIPCVGGIGPVHPYIVPNGFHCKQREVVEKTMLLKVVSGLT